MADIVPSLFGLTPEMYTQARDQRADEQALAFAKLSPFEKASFGIGRGAYGLAGAVGRALGGEDPELQRISFRNSIAKQTDLTDPESMVRGIQALTQAEDMVGAKQLYDILLDFQGKQALIGQREASAMASRAAAGRERAQATPADIIKAQRIGEITVQLQNQSLPPQERANLEAQLAALQTDKKASLSPQLQLVNDIESTQSTIDTLSAQPPSPERDGALRRAKVRLAALERQLPKEARDERFGVEREAVSMEVYNKPFSQLTQTERAAVNKRVEEEQGKKAAAGAPKFELPGQKALVDIPGFRSKVQATIRPQLDAINSADQALQAINDSLSTGNFVSFNAARVQLAKALGDSQLSRRDVEQAGGDPSILGGLIDLTSKAFTSTPGVDTQKKIRDTLTAIRTVATNKAKAEVDVQRKIALRSPGYDAAAVDQALAFPELAVPAPGAAQGTLAEQAAAELARRRGEKK